MSTPCHLHSNKHGRALPPLAIEERLMFITHATASLNEYEETNLLLQGGCRWIQLRRKEGIDAALAQKIVDRCHQVTNHPVRIFLDDDVTAALQSGASGVHLGKNDMPLSQAWAFVDEALTADRPFHIGATANTFDDIIEAANNGASYIGLGPYRFTATKKNLSPVLGLQGYRSIVKQCREAGIHLPIFAIGGIELHDVKPLLQTGIDGIAVSGSILQATDPVEMTKRFLQAIRDHFQEEANS